MINLSVRLSAELGRPISNKPFLKLYSAKNTNLVLKEIKNLPYETLEDLGDLARVSYKNRSLGIVGSRPIIPIVTENHEDYIKIAGFCFRNCKRVLIFDVFGGSPLLKNIYDNTLSPIIYLKFANDRSNTECAFIESIPFRNEYYFNLIGPSRQKVPFGSLEYPIFTKDFEEDITMFPVWNSSIKNSIFKKIYDKNLNLNAIIYLKNSTENDYDFWGKFIDGKRIIAS